MSFSITSANSALTLSVAGLFSTPQNIQGYAVDDAYDSDEIEPAEVQMGVDGIMSSGWVPTIKSMKIMLQSDSASVDFFEAWFNAQEANREVLLASGSLAQPSIGKNYALVNGVLRGYKPFAGAGKVLKPRSFTIMWNSTTGSGS